MPNKLSRPGIISAKIVRDLLGLRADQRGTIAVMMGLLIPVLIGSLGLGFEISNWYLRTRAMQNAADAAAIAAASNGGANYDLEAKAVAARPEYAFVDGSNNVTVLPEKGSAPAISQCPAGKTCYRVTITSAVPLFLSQVVGYTGDTTVNGAQEKSLSSVAVAQSDPYTTPICLLGLGTTGKAIRANGSPKTDFTGCSIMSDSDALCNGSDLNAVFGLAAGSSSGCGSTQISEVPKLTTQNSPALAKYDALENIIPANTCTPATTPPPLKKKGSTWSGGTGWTAGSAWPTGSTQTTVTSPSGDSVTYVQVCGDLQLKGAVTIAAATPTVLVIRTGQMDLNGLTLKTSNVTIVFDGTSGSPTDHTTGGSGILDVQAPTTGSWSGVGLYGHDTTDSILYKGNNPAWDISGLVYFPKADVTLDGAVNKSSNGAACMVMVADTVLIDGTGSFYNQTPAGCTTAGLAMPTAIIGKRGQLVY
ncbi:MAG TPA: pilus assembly protein TadG-related protein [Pseudolabrys sp.]